MTHLYAPLDNHLLIHTDWPAIATWLYPAQLNSNSGVQPVLNETVHLLPEQPIIVTSAAYFA